MSAGRWDITIEKGATFDPVLIWSNKDPVTGVKTPVDLTGWTVRSQVRRTVGDSTIALDMGPYIALGGVEGTIIFNVPEAVTALLTIKSGVWDLELVSPGGAKVKRLVEGTVKIKENVTRPA